MTMLGLIPGAFAVGGISLMATGSGTSRTRAGRDLWSRVGGFRRMLATPSSKERFDFSGRKELYTAYIPWAVALGCAEEWAAKYRIEVGEEPPVPHYFAGAYAGANAGAFVTRWSATSTAPSTRRSRRTTPRRARPRAAAGAAASPAAAVAAAVAAGRGDRRPCDLILSV